MGIGKIIIRHKGKKIFGFFSPACCFDEAKRKKGELKYYPLEKGVNTIACSCGRVYRVTVNGEFDEFDKITKEIVYDGGYLKVHFSDVQWDTDGEAELESDFNAFVPAPESEDTDIDEYLSDWLSDTYGFCHKGFNYRISKEICD